MTNLCDVIVVCGGGLLAQLVILLDELELVVKISRNIKETAKISQEY